MGTALEVGVDLYFKILLRHSHINMGMTPPPKGGQYTINTYLIQNFDKNTILVYNSTRLCADIAQLVERTHGKGEVISSILIIGSPNYIMILL